MIKCIIWPKTWKDQGLDLETQTLETQETDLMEDQSLLIQDQVQVTERKMLSVTIVRTKVIICMNVNH